MKNYYDILQVSPKADAEVIKGAYRQLALKFHPDSGKKGASEEMMKLLNEAYEVLSSPTKRTHYDDLLGTDRPPISVGREKVGTEVSRTLLLASDFSVYSQHWMESDENDCCSFRRDGFYHIGVRRASWEQYYYPRTLVKDFEVTVDAQLTCLGPGSEYGLVFRLVQNAGINSFYRFALSSRGYYSLFACIDGRYQTIRGFHVCSTIHTNGAANRITLRACSETIEVKVNEIPLLLVQDTGLAEPGYVGLLASRAANDPYVEARFRNYQLFRL